MKNFLSITENEKDVFRERGSYLSGQEFHSQPPAANRSSFLSEGRFNHSSVSLDSPPSFLTRTPLGTPHDETVELKSKVVIFEKTRQESRVSAVPSAVQVFERAESAPKKRKQKTEQPKRPVKSYKGMGVNGVIQRWIYGEVRLSMSKMSIMSLLLGLLFLGTLFFIIGFLAAVATLGPAEHSSQSAWQASNVLSQEQAKSGPVGGKFGSMLGNVGGGIVGNAVRQQLAPVNRALGTTSAMVPRSLQPFARYGTGRARSEVRTASNPMNLFPQRGRGPAPMAPIAAQQAYYGSPPPPVQQQYPPIPQAQAYGPPAAPGYQSPPLPQGMPQEGAGNYGSTGYGPTGYGQGYAPPQQQPMMMQQPMQQQMQPPMAQQPYYQPPAPPQPMPQQAFLPQQAIASPSPMGFQPQMMQQPQYQQPIAPQQGYYR